MSLDERKAMWQQRIEAFQLSGESNIKAWCQKHEVDSKGMYRWMSKLKLESTPSDTATQWVALESISSANHVASTIVVNVNGASIELKEGFNHNLFLEIFQVLKTHVE